jgi:hypothetical protein
MPVFTVFGTAPDVRSPRRSQEDAADMVAVVGAATDSYKTTGSEIGRGLPAALKTIAHSDHCSTRRNFGISREFRSKFANRDDRDSSDHCSTD